MSRESNHVAISDVPKSTLILPTLEAKDCYRVSKAWKTVESCNMRVGCTAYLGNVLCPSGSRLTCAVFREHWTMIRSRHMWERNTYVFQRISFNNFNKAFSC